MNHTETTPPAAQCAVCRLPCPECSDRRPCARKGLNRGYADKLRARPKAPKPTEPQKP